MLVFCHLPGIDKTFSPSQRKVPLSGRFLFSQQSVTSKEMFLLREIGDPSKVDLHRQIWTDFFVQNLNVELKFENYTAASCSKLSLVGVRVFMCVCECVCVRACVRECVCSTVCEVSVH